MNSEFIRHQPAFYPGDGGAGIPLVTSSGGFLSWYHTVVLATALGVIYANLPIYSYVLHAGILPKFFFFGLFFLFAPLLLIKSRALSVYMATPFALWVSLLVILNLIHVAGFAMDSGVSGTSVINRQMEARNALVLTRIQYILFAWFLGFIVYVSNRQSYQRIFAYLAVLLPCLVLLDFMRPGLLYPLNTSGAVLGRAAAMFINPTMAGEALLLAFLFGCAAIKMKYRTLLFLLLGAGLLVTFSRSSIIAWALLWPLLIATRVLPRSAIVVTAITVVASLLSVSVFESYISSRQDFEGAIGNLQARLNFFSSGSLTDDSALERAEVISAGWELFTKNPVFGSGAAATYFWSQRASTHNQLLMLAAEYGLFGIGLWTWLVIILWRGEFFQNRGLQIAVTFLFVFMSMFTHQMFDSASYWLATFALASVKKRRSVLYVPESFIPVRLAQREQTVTTPFVPSEKTQ